MLLCTNITAATTITSKIDVSTTSGTTVVAATTTASTTAYYATMF